jgi:hypothetical protein
MPPLPRVEIEARRDQRYGWVLVPMTIGGQVSINMIVNLGVPRSSISAATRDQLITKELVPPRRDRTYVLDDVTVQGQLLPAFTVRVSGALGRIGAGGILGLDFFAQYEDIHFHVPSFRLALNGP